MKRLAILTRPSAFLPFVMSGLALEVVLGYLALNGPAPQADEWTAAHLWQLLMAAQVPTIIFFAIRWIPQSPRQAMSILALQVGAAIAAMTPVMLLHW